MKEICKEDLVTTGSELLGPEVRKKISERANTIEAFNKAIASVEGTSSQKTNTSSCFYRSVQLGSRGADQIGVATPHTTSSDNQGIIWWRLGGVCGL